MQHEIRILYKKASDATEINRSKEVIKVDVENIPLPFVLDRIRND